MNYIVLDLEWNQGPEDSKVIINDLPSEILEIGAVKLDDKKHIVDTYQQLIKPQIYHELNVKTKELTQINETDIVKGEYFDVVINQFFDWCGEDYIFCTWGVMDLTELQRNLGYFKKDIYFDNVIQYYDIQKLFSVLNEDKSIRSLEYAVDFLSIEKKESFHRAVNDARYTAYIFQNIETNLAEENLSFDCYHNPKTKEDEISIVYGNSYKYISREFEKRENILSRAEITSMKCFECGSKTHRKIKWFTNNSKTYYCLAQCESHGYIRGKIQIKKASNGKYFVIKTLRFIRQAEVDYIIQKRKEVGEKRKRQKRKRER